MSKEVKRYFVEGPDWELIEDEIGELVEYEAYSALLAERDALKAELADLVRVVGMSVDGSSARNKAMEKAFAALQGEQP